jgi:release factor glutamine methyltransferase
VPSPDLDAALLLAHVLGVDRSRLRTEPHRAVGAADQDALDRVVAERVRRRPLAQILGRREFRSLDFEVTGDVLTPRPETELLVDVAAEACDRAAAEGRAPVVVDVGTGSGCIAVAVAVERPAAQVHGSDASGAALAVARRNVARHGVAERVTLHRGDLLAPIARALGAGSVDAVVSNPPYVRRSEAGECDPEVLWEPAGAVFCDGEPAPLYARIAKDAWPLLRPGGVLAVETSDLDAAGATELASTMLAAAGAPQGAFDVRQHGGSPRVLVLRR